MLVSSIVVEFASMRVGAISATVRQLLHKTSTVPEAKREQASKREIATLALRIKDGEGGQKLTCPRRCRS